jgi:prepilin-type N-terminal cleavage/methylation domain-containing protein
MSCRKGFSLVELAISIIIIGLLVAGVTSGTKLIKQAELRAYIADMDAYIVAVNTFKATFDELPGDFANASTIWSNCAQTNVNCNGNGDGKITWNNANVAPGVSDETVKSIRHMYLAGVMQNAGSVQILDGYANYFQYLHNDSGAASFPPLSGGSDERLFMNVGDPAFSNVIWFIGGANPFGGGVHAVYVAREILPQGGQSYMRATLSPLDAFSIDKKYDNGSYSGSNAVGADTGNIRTLNGDLIATNCKSSTDVYNISSTEKNCIIGKKAF